MSTRASPPATSSLRRSLLLLAHVAWVAVAIAALAIVVFSVPSSFEHYRSVCTAASEVCSERALSQPTPKGVRALNDVGLSVRSYALLNIAIDKVFQLVWFAVGALIFWRRSDNRMALLTCYGIWWFNRRKTKTYQEAVNGPDGKRSKKRVKITQRPESEWIAVPVPESGTRTSGSTLPGRPLQTT